MAAGHPPAPPHPPPKLHLLSFREGINLPMNSNIHARFPISNGLAIMLAALLTILLVLAPVHAQMPEEVVVAFQPQESVARIAPNAERMAAHLSAELGIPVRVYLPTSYSAVVEAMRAGQADVAYFDARPFTVAQSLASAEAVVAELRDGQTWYYSQWFVRNDSEIQRLEDLRGKRVAFTSPLSTSGYLFPYARLVKDGLVERRANPDTFLGSHVFAGGYQQALLALYHGQVDAACVSAYAFERYLTPEQQAEVRVLDQQGPVPTHLIAVRRELSPEFKQRLRDALLGLNAPENQQLLQEVYGARGFVAVDDSHVNALKEALELTGIHPVPGESFDHIGGTPAEGSAQTPGFHGGTQPAH